MPRLGLGVLKAQDGQEVEQAVLAALDHGYRLIDTAAVYKNEKGVGYALKKSGIPREEIFLTTKVWNSDQGYEATFRAFAKSLEQLQTDYIDLYLIHWPVAGKYKDTWRALEQLYRLGKIKAIGVSNFQTHHLDDLMRDAEVMPMVNQVEMHPHLQQEALLSYAHRHNIVLEAWRPIMMGEVNQLPELKAISERHGKTPVQVALRWLVQRGVVVIPDQAKNLWITFRIDFFEEKEITWIPH